MKKVVVSLLVLICLLSLAPKYKLIADEENSSGENINLEKLCDFKRDDYDKNDPRVKNYCDKYFKGKALASDNRLKELDQKLKNLKNEKDKLGEEITKAKKIGNDLKIEVEKIQEEIKTVKGQIHILEKSIAENEKKVAEIKERVFSRMKNAQKKMHFNPFLEFLLGSSSFADLNRRLYGLNALISKDNDDRQKIIVIIRKLKSDKKDLDVKKEELDKKCDIAEEQLAEIRIIEDNYTEALEIIQDEMEKVLAEKEKERKNYADLASRTDLSGLPSSAGLISPAPGASINAGTWYYPSSFGGGVHLGVDYGLGLGSPLYAPANGIVIVSSDGCDYGYLGDRCSGNGNGVAYGGNQVYMMVAANGSVYVVSFSHLLKGSPVGIGPIKQGDYVGKVGSSGNSTGPHCHIELFYLGEGEMEDIQNDYLKRNYSQSFNCGWGYSALDRLCENGVGAPCRLKPENYLGS